MDEGCTHQGSWGRVGDVAGTAMLKTQAAVQSRSINTFFLTYKLVLQAIQVQKSTYTVIIIYILYSIAD